MDDIRKTQESFARKAQTQPEVPVENAASLLQALARTVKFMEYRKLEGTAIPTLSPTSMPVMPPPVITPTLPVDLTYLQIPVSDLTQLGEFDLNKPADGQLVIVYGNADNPDLPYLSAEFCVKVVVFLDKNSDAHIGFEKEQSQNVVIQLNTNDLRDYGESMAAQVGVYLVPNPNCVVNPTVTATP